MSALSIRNMNWEVGQAELNETTEPVSDERLTEIRDEVATGLQRDLANYWASKVTLNWEAASMVLDLCDGTLPLDDEYSLIFSGGEIIDRNPISQEMIF